ncbi:MAG: hypothetical protein FWD40_09270 [Treponema sp.]|nr:hypothetical protein [Treponema sp.]
MKKYLNITTIAAIVAIAVIAILLMACTRKAADADFSIYGQWRYTGSADVEHDETWHEDGLNIITIHDGDGSCIIEFANSVYYGLLLGGNDNWYQFNAYSRLDLESGEIFNIEGQGPYTFIFGYDAVKKRLIEADHTVERYFEWAGYAGSPPVAPSGTAASASAATSDYNIYGEWRYVITGFNTGDIYAEDWKHGSVLRIFENESSSAIVEFVRGENIYYGDLTETGNYVYRFTYLSVSEYGEYVMTDTLTFDPATGRFGQEDGESMMSVSYYEWAGPAGAPPQAQNQNSRLHGTWVSDLNTLMFLEPNIFHEEGGTSVAGGRNTFTYNFDGRTLTISTGNDDSSHAKATINGDVLEIGSFEGDHEWHYNTFLWGTFRKTQ